MLWQRQKKNQGRTIIVAAVIIISILTLESSK